MIPGLKYEHLPAAYQIVAEAVGLEVAGKLIEELGGTQIYIPKIGSCEKYLDDYILKNMHKSPKVIAVELAVAERTIHRRLLRAKEYNLVKSV